MKAIVLAAGKWTRMRPITETIPKPLIKIAGKPIMEHNMDHIYKSVDEIIIVIKYLGEKITEYFGDQYKWTKITYIEQWEWKWTWAALKGISFEWDFILLYADSIFEEKDLQTLIDLDWYGCLTREMEDPSKYGVFVKDENRVATKVIEKPKEFYWNTTNVWVYKFSSSIFKMNDSIWLSPRGEYELTDSINLFCQEEDFHLIDMKWKFIDVWSPWDIFWANEDILWKLEQSEIYWIVEDWVSIKGNIILEEWAVLKSGTYIEWNVYIWKNCSIWPNCYIRWTSTFWEGCRIGNAVEIKNSHFGNYTNAWHLTYIWDSIVWNNCNFWAWFKVANLRHDAKNMRAINNGELVDTWRKKLWMIVWDGSKTGIWTLCYPWRVLEPETFTLPWEIIK